MLVLFGLMIGITVVCLVIVTIVENSEEQNELKKKNELRTKLAALEGKEGWADLVAEQENSLRYEDLPTICPKCGKYPRWKAIDYTTERNFDSAYSLMGSTTVFIDEKRRNRLMCQKCGYEIYAYSKKH